MRDRGIDCRQAVVPNKCWYCCGDEDDAITIALRGHAHHVVATDIDRDKIDFLERTIAPPDVGAIVINPPFSLAADFVWHGWCRSEKSSFSSTSNFWKAIRVPLFEAGKLVRVRVFRDRVPRMHRRKRASPAMMLAWFVFDRNHDGSAPTLNWIRGGGFL